MSDAKPVRRPRHLMDPDNPKRSSSSTDRSLTNVQKWVMSVLAVTTILHLQVGLLIGAMAIGDGHLDAQIGLFVIATVFGVLAVASGMLIHQRSPASPWLLLGLVPTLIALPFLL